MCLKRQRIGNKLLIGFNNAPTVEALLKIKGVTEAEVADNNMMRVRFAEMTQCHTRPLCRLR